MAQGVLLYAAADVIDGLVSQFHYVEGVQDGAGVFQAFVDGVLVPVERVQGGDRDPAAEALTTRIEPNLVGLARGCRG